MLHDSEMREEEDRTIQALGHTYVANSIFSLFVHCDFCPCCLEKVSLHLERPGHAALEVYALCGSMQYIKIGGKTNHTLPATEAPGVL